MATRTHMSSSLRACIGSAWQIYHKYVYKNIYLRVAIKHHVRAYTHTYDPIDWPYDSSVSFIHSRSKEKPNNESDRKSNRMQYLYTLVLDQIIWVSHHMMINIENNRWHVSYRNYYQEKEKTRVIISIVNHLYVALFIHCCTLLFAWIFSLFFFSSFYFQHIFKTFLKGYL